MQLVNMDVERHGSRGPISLGPLSPGLNALCGPAGSGRTTLLSWLRQLAYEDQQRSADGLGTAWNHTRPAVLGSVEVANRGLRFRLGSHSTAPPGHTHSSYAHDARPLDPARSNLTARQLDAFAAMASTNHIVNPASYDTLGGNESELEVTAQRLGLDVQPPSSYLQPDREHLFARQCDIESRLQHLNQLHSSRETLLARRDDLQRELQNAHANSFGANAHGSLRYEGYPSEHRRSDYTVHQDTSGRTYIAYTGDADYPSSSNLADTLRRMQKELYEACQQLARHESHAAAEALKQQSQQLQQLQRSESELQYSVEKLIEDRERLLREAEDLRQRLATAQPVRHTDNRFRTLVHRHIAGLMGGRERVSSRANYRNSSEGIQRRYDLVDGIVYDHERRCEAEVPSPLVRVAQRLAIAEAMAMRAEPIPVLIDEALDRLSQDDQATAIAYLARIAAAGQQILLMTGNECVAELVRQQHGWVAYLQPNVAPAMDINRHLTAVANDYEAAKWFHPNVSSEPLRSTTQSSPFYLTERSRIEESPSIDGVLATRLRAIGVDRIGDLLDVDPHWLAEQLRQDGVSDATVASWQAEARLLCSVRHLRPFDARLLVSIGVRTPQQLADMHPSQLLDRVERFVATDRGRRFLRSGSSYELSRITNWIASAKGGAGRFQGSSFVDHDRGESYRNGYDTERDSLDSYPTDYERDAHRDFTRRSRTGADLSQLAPGDANYEDDFNTPRRESTTRRTSDRGGSGDSRRQRRSSTSSRSGRARSSDRSSRDYPNLHRSTRSTAASDRKIKPAVAREERSERQSRPRFEREAREPRRTEAIKLAETARLKFYLELASPVVDAPSIGPRMATRLEALGIFSVDQLLAANAESLTDKLNLRRIDATTVRAWQEQARLVCRIPNLRGHDAQLLVACNLTSPEELATMQAASVLAQVLVVAESSEGQRILRGSKQPDLAEVKDWIHWASQCRSLNAA